MARLKRQHLREQEARLPKVRLGDLADQGLNVLCWCNRCDHHAVIETALLISRLGPATPVPEVGAAMRCTSCGSRDVATRPNWPSFDTFTRHGAVAAGAAAVPAGKPEPR